MLKKLIVALCFFNLLPAASLRPNIILFTIDSCRADRFGVYGSQDHFTPNIDRWARRGTIFKNAYSTSAWTVPGLVSILTGLYPPTHGINNRDRMGSPDLLTLIKIFKQRGYRVPNLNFFTFAPYYHNLGLGPVERKYFGDRPGDELISWLSEAVAGDNSSPFFLWYHTTIVHQPYNPPDSALPMPRAQLMKRPGIKAVMSGAIVPRGSTTFSASDRPILNALYGGELQEVDGLFQRMLGILQKAHLASNTLIVLTADHGEELLDHGFVGHASTSLKAKLYQELVHIPLILVWPGKVPSGRVLTYPVDQTDIFPTLLKLLGEPVPSFVQGQYLFRTPGQRELFFESVGAGNQTTKAEEGTWIRGVLRWPFKYISNGELYDLKKDPAERHNLLGETAGDRALAARLKQDLQVWLNKCRRDKEKIFPHKPQVYSGVSAAHCPIVFSPGDESTLSYDQHTGAILLDWQGSLKQTYLLQYDIGAGDHHLAGTYEVQGNHQVFGPLPRELWVNVKQWNPFRFRVSPEQEQPCWSQWVTFRF